MRYKLSLLGVVVVAGVLSLLLVLHHFDARQAPTAQPLQSSDLSQPELTGAHVQAPQDKVAPDDVTSSCNGNAPGMADPAAVYCHELGYEYQVVDGAEGQYGVCDFPDGSSCDAWRFLEGTCGQGYSYCAKQGYGLVTKTDGKNSLSREYSVCVQGQQEIGSVTELMHLSEKATRGSARPEQSPVPPAEGPSTEAEAPSAPTSFDWRSYNGQDWMTSVKDQGNCGSCWAYSAVGAVESAYNISTSNPNLDLDLSEEYLVSDCHSYNGYDNCCGGWNNRALNFIRDSGISDEACFPYVDALTCTCGDTCNTDCTYHTGSNCSDATCSDRCTGYASRLTRIQATGGPVAAGSMKDTLVQKGPLSVCFGYGSTYGGYWDGDIYRCADDSGTNHCVVIAGYNGAADGYWIAKNSWGPSFGPDHNGYFKVGYGECDIASQVYYADAPSCSGGQYKLTMQVSPPGAGTTTPSRGINCYSNGRVVPISASANAGWQFTGWSGDADCSDGSVTVNSNKTCVANFSHAGCNTYTSTDVPKAIPDLTTITSTLNVGSSFTLTDVNVGPLNITHTYDSDLNVSLISPHGTHVQLFTHVGGSGDNFTNTVLDDECTTPITSGTAPFTGCYRPEGSLSALDGQSSAGVWTLEVTDGYAEDTGTLQSWQLELCGQVPAPDRFFGDVTLNGSPAPPGTNVAATIGGNVCGQTTVKGDSTYVLDVVSSGQTAGCGTEGATVNFTVAGLAAGTGTWYSGRFTVLDLVAISGPDTDGDGCSDAEEMGADPLLGGQRDPLNPYDFYDVPRPVGQPGTGTRDKQVDGNDALAVLSKFGASPGDPYPTAPKYDPAYDRSAPPAVYPGAGYWRTGAPNGVQDANDVLWNLWQFGHSCVLPP